MDIRGRRKPTGRCLGLGPGCETNGAAASTTNQLQDDQTPPVAGSSIYRVRLQAKIEAVLPQPFKNMDNEEISSGQILVSPGSTVTFKAIPQKFQDNSWKDITEPVVWDWTPNSFQHPQLPDMFSSIKFSEPNSNSVELALKAQGEIDISKSALRAFNVKFKTQNGEVSQNTGASIIAREEPPLAYDSPCRREWQTKLCVGLYNPPNDSITSIQWYGVTGMDHYLGLRPNTCLNVPVNKDIPFRSKVVNNLEPLRGKIEFRTSSNNLTVNGQTVSSVNHDTVMNLKLTGNEPALLEFWVDSSQKLIQRMVISPIGRACPNITNYDARDKKSNIFGRGQLLKEGTKVPSLEEDPSGSFEVVHGDTVNLTMQIQEGVDLETKRAAFPITQAPYTMVVEVNQGVISTDGGKSWWLKQSGIRNGTSFLYKAFDGYQNQPIAPGSSPIIKVYAELEPFYSSPASWIAPPKIWEYKVKLKDKN